MVGLSLPFPAIPTTVKPYRHEHTSARPHGSFECLKDDLIRQANGGRVREAISTLDSMSRANLTPDLTSYSVLLKSCIRTRNYELGQQVHSRLAESGLELDVIVLNSLISLYSKSGDWWKAEELFDSMGGNRDLVSWSAMISCYAHNGFESKAIRMFAEMVEAGECPNQFCFSAAIRACSNIEHARIGLVIFGFLTKTGYFESDVCVGCALVDLFAKGFGDLKSARKVFDEMPERNSVSWTLMITRLAQLGACWDAIEMFPDMIVAGNLPDRFTFSSCLSVCAELGLLQTGQQLHGWVVKNGLCGDVCVGCSLVDMYAKSALDGSMGASRKVFDRMPEHNVMSWTALITGYVQNGRHEDEAIEMYYRMLMEGRVLPNHFTFATLLKACSNLFDWRLGGQIHGQAVKFGVVAINCVGNSLIAMYAKNDRMDDARTAFEFLFEKNLVSYNTLVDAYARRNDSDSSMAFELLKQIESSSIGGVDSFTYASLLSAAASIGAVGKGEQIHAHLLKTGFESNLCVSNALISMYTRCGDIQAGFRVFHGTVQQNVITWTSIITGFAKHGFAQQALHLFNQMLSCGIRPNEVTYVAVLSACSHAGMVNEGWAHFHAMHQEHGIKPRMEHYACMVDILGRSRLLSEAAEFITAMPFPADALVWRTLLSACRVHGDVELGKRAAEKILTQEPDDSATHVLLSNLYAATGQWAEAGSVRKEMKERNVAKEAGCSWIEVSGRVHRFHAGDTGHSQAKEIYRKLDEMGDKIRVMGYVSDRESVLHEVGEEMKEQLLWQHSEKLALAYGLIRTGEGGGRVVRIFKNLRVCGDCHRVFKHVSRVYKKEIVVRDSNRFHHFRDGDCSCNDYW